MAAAHTSQRCLMNQMKCLGTRLMMKAKLYGSLTPHLPPSHRLQVGALTLSIPLTLKVAGVTWFDSMVGMQARHVCTAVLVVCMLTFCRQRKHPSQSFCSESKLPWHGKSPSSASVGCTCCAAPMNALTYSLKYKHLGSETLLHMQVEHTHMACNSEWHLCSRSKCVPDTIAYQVNDCELVYKTKVQQFTCYKQQQVTTR